MIASRKWYGFGALLLLIAPMYLLSSEKKSNNFCIDQEKYKEYKHVADDCYNKLNNDQKNDLPFMLGALEERLATLEKEQKRIDRKRYCIECLSKLEDYLSHFTMTPMRCMVIGTILTSIAYVTYRIAKTNIWNNSEEIIVADEYDNTTREL